MEFDIGSFLELAKILYDEASPSVAGVALTIRPLYCSPSIFARGRPFFVPVFHALSIDEKSLKPSHKWQSMLTQIGRTNLRRAAAK